MSTPRQAAPGPDEPRQAPTRRARFRRQKPPAIRLMEDDVAAMRHVAAHRFLRSTHIVALLDRSGKKVLERLAALYHNGYLDRPRAQLDYYATAGSAPFVYALGNKGAAILAEQGGAKRPKVDWTWKNRDAGRVFIEHTLLIADLMVAIQIATRRAGNISLIDAAEILKDAPASTQKARNPWSLPARVNHAGTQYDLSLIPDKIFGLDYLDARKRSYFFVEADRGTMPVTRSHPRQTSFQQKMLGYLAGSRPVNTHAQHLGIGNFRVLTITTTRERIATMVAALKAVSNGTGSNQFLFVDRESLTTSPDALSLDWTTGKGEVIRLRI